MKETITNILIYVVQLVRHVKFSLNCNLIPNHKLIMHNAGMPSKHLLKLPLLATSEAFLSLNSLRNTQNVTSI